MGKKLRNRQIHDDTDFDTASNLPIQPTLRLDRSSLRKMVGARIGKFQHLQERRIRFGRRVRGGEVGGLVRGEELECPICMELMVAPTALMCGHVFCYRCLESNCAYSQRCSLCRFEQGDLPTRPSSLAETLIQTFLLPRMGEQLLGYLCRLTDSAQWIKKRRVGALRGGSVVDLRTEGVWRRAVVVRTFINDDQKNMAQIRMGGREQQSTQVLEVNSPRLAPYTFFTRGRYLLDFPPQLPEHDVAEREMRGLQYRPMVEEEEFFRGGLEGVESGEQEDVGEGRGGQSLLEEAIQLLGWGRAQEVELGF